VDNIDLDLHKGESLAIIGHNGAGKTTLMKLVLGLTRPSAGTINHWSCENSGNRITASNNSIGFLPESVAFPGTINGRKMLSFYARLKRQPQRQCDQLLELVGLTNAANQKINTYSKGMRQRLGLAQALLGNPDLLLLDEPTSGLDPFLRSHFYEIVSARQLSGTSVIISSHALTEIEARTDRIAIMKAGRLLEQGSLEQLRARAALPVRILVRHKTGQGETLVAEVAQPVSVEYLNEGELLLSCPEKDKLRWLHHLSAQSDSLLDITVRTPGLDELYTYFVNGDRT